MKTETFTTGRDRFAANNELVRLQRNRRDLMLLDQKPQFLHLRAVHAEPF